MSWSCRWEAELVRALRQGWPHGADPALAAHVAACRHCRQTVRIATALRSAAPPPAPAVAASPGALWWRAQLRLRYRSLERAGRPLLWAQLAALAALLAVMAAIAFGLRHAAAAFARSAAQALQGSLGPAWIAAFSLSALLLALLAGFLVAGRD